MQFYKILFSPACLLSTHSLSLSLKQTHTHTHTHTHIGTHTHAANEFMTIGIISLGCSLSSEASSSFPSSSSSSSTSPGPAVFLSQTSHFHSPLQSLKINTVTHKHNTTLQTTERERVIGIEREREGVEEKERGRER